MPYITYLTNLGRTNTADSHAGYGLTKEEAQQSALYWSNQLPWVRTVAFSRAPKWAIEEARQAYHENCHACGKIHPPGSKNRKCVNQRGFLLPVTKDWPTEVAAYEF